VSGGVQGVAGCGLSASQGAYQGHEAEEGEHADPGVDQRPLAERLGPVLGEGDAALLALEAAVGVDRAAPGTAQAHRFDFPGHHPLVVGDSTFHLHRQNRTAGTATGQPGVVEDAALRTVSHSGQSLHYLTLCWSTSPKASASSLARRAISVSVRRALPGSSGRPAHFTLPGGRSQHLTITIRAPAQPSGLAPARHKASKPMGSPDASAVATAPSPVPPPRARS
jgi:hypothetical protein